MSDADRAVLAELVRSVYLTTREREALRRVLGDRGKWRLAPAIARATAAEPGAFEEDERHALLGPCGAE